MGRRRLLMFTMKMPVSDEILLGEKRLTSFQCLGQIAGHYFSCLTYPCVLERNDNCAFGSGSLYNEICMSFWCSFQNFEGNSPCLGSPVSAPGLPRAGSSASGSFQSANSNLICPHISLLVNLQRIPDLHASQTQHAPN